MLKITVETNATPTRVILEGRLTGPWVEELSRYWHTVPQAQLNGTVVDLTGVTFIAPEGKALLGQMSQEGAKLLAAGCLTRCIVDEITQATAAQVPGARVGETKDQ